MTLTPTLTPFFKKYSNKVNKYLQRYRRYMNINVKQSQKKLKESRSAIIRQTPSDIFLTVFEVQGTTGDNEPVDETLKPHMSWLDFAIAAFGSSDGETYSQPTASAFAKTSTCL